MTENVISSKVIGSADPVSKKIRSFKSAIGGVGCGFVLLIIGFVLIYNSIYGVKEYSKIVAALPSMKAEEVTTNQDLAKITGIVSNSTPITLNYSKCADKSCNPLTNSGQKIENLFYYDYQKQRYEIVKTVRQETRTKEFAGQETEETVEVTEYNEQWVTKESNNSFGSFNLASLKVEPNTDTKMIVDKKTQEISDIVVDNVEALNNYGQAPGPMVGSTKLVINSIPVLNDKQVIVVGKVESGTVKSGDPFIITTNNETKLLSDLGQEETFQRVALLIF